MKELLRALAETLVEEAVTALEDNGTSIKDIDREELSSQFKSLLEARAESEIAKDLPY
jgi:hypothetical protein